MHDIFSDEKYPCALIVIGKEIDKQSIKAAQWWVQSNILRWDKDFRVVAVQRD